MASAPTYEYRDMHHQQAGVSFALIMGFVEGLKPEPRLSIVEWAEANRTLDSKAAAEPGPYRVSRTPYLKEIYDNLNPHSGVIDTIVMKGAQLGFTETGFNWMACKVARYPGSMMYLMPTIQTMERNVKARVDPMVEKIPALTAKIGKKRSKDGGNTLHQKDYDGGVIYFSGANSAASLASIAVQDIIFDEVDRFPGDVDGEGDPVGLAENRQETFGTKKKRYKISTPTVKGASRIESDFEKTDKRYYFVPCIHCNELQVLKFTQLRWEPGKYDVDEVYYECPHCNGKMYERDKTYMLANGRWIPTVPEKVRPDVRGYHISSLYSPDGWLRWGSMCEESDKAQGNTPKLKTFTNTKLGETFEEESEAPEWEALYNRAQAFGVEANKPMSSVAFITAGVDVQQDRLEIEIVGWIKGRICQQIDYRTLEGDPDEEDVWDKLAEVLDETFPREDGAILPIRLMCIDTGYKAGRVDDFAKKHTDRVKPVKGMDNLQIPFSAPKVSRKTKQGKNIGKLKVWGVGVSYLKGQLYGWLKQKVNPDTGVIPNGYCYFTKQPDTYFRGLTAEALERQTNKKNQTVMAWVKKYARNEPLDIRVYNMAAAYMHGFDRWNDERWERERSSVPVYDQPVSKATSKPEKKKRPPRNNDEGSSYWDRD